MPDFHDHGDYEIDLYWMARLQAGTPLSEVTGEDVIGPLMDRLPPEYALYVPPEFQDHQRIPEDSEAVCWAIWNAS